jgi:hypothetical protein
MPDVGFPQMRTGIEEQKEDFESIHAHLKRNGDPGWQTLGRGFEKLILLDAGFRNNRICGKDAICPKSQNQQFDIVRVE